MSAEYNDTTLAHIRDVISRLQSPIPDVSTLLPLLASPLASLGLLPPRFRKYVLSPLPSEAFDVPRYAPLLQRALLEHVIPVWEPVLVQENAYDLVEQYFCPDTISFASATARQLALYAYSTLLSVPLKDCSLRLLAKLVKGYPVDVLHAVVFSHRSNTSSSRYSVSWEDCVRNVVAVPVKVANYMGERRDVPNALEHGPYFRDVSVRTEHLIFSSRTERSQERASSIAYLLAKLVNVGIFPASPPALPAQPSFFQATLPLIRNRMQHDDSEGYSAIWAKLLSLVPSSLTLRSILTSLFSHLTPIPSGLDGSLRTRAVIKREASLVRSLVGALKSDNSELVECFSAVALGRTWEEGHARIFACWAAGGHKGERTREGLDILLSKAMDIWTDADHIRHSLLSQHKSISCTRPGALPPFVQSISTYISHLDPSVRRCGMLVAEEVARAAGKSLNFGEWDGDDQGRAWCRQLRELTQACDVDVDEQPEELETIPAPELQPVVEDSAPQPAKAKATMVVLTAEHDSDDSLTGYASPASSRSPSPTPSELEEIEHDPTLRVGVKKVPRPVYLAQLGELIRPTSGLQGGDEQVTATKIEVALDVAEELIRRKSGYGTELEENAVNLVHGFVGLQDNYDLEGFDQKRQAALNALVACCPRKAAPSIIEEFFRNQYSTDQRFVMLNALALGARELASLPVPELPGRLALPKEKVAFPSKRLPPAQHEKYLTAGDQLRTSDPVGLLLEGISQEAIDKGKEATAEKLPEFVRERSLRVRPSSKVAEVRNDPSSTRAALMQQLVGPQHPKRTTFTEVAAEFFICPFIHRFWLFLRDEQTREERTAHQPVLHRYRGAGTGLVLSALVLGRFLETLAVLVHAARNAREWLAVIAPDALELALTLGTRPLSRGEGADDVDADSEDTASAGRSGENKQNKEAALLTAALELAVIVLDGCLDLDGGRSLGLEHTALLLGTGEWAEKVFKALEDGQKVLGGGGKQEVRLRRAAAGVILKVDELTTKWRRSMVDLV
ncbi:telomere length regulation protein-domain-containing protein [Trametes punicea]|nr:telomere length regulation protein-domain-containing protein [Trametes punicea]